MAAAAVATPKLLTAAEFAALPDPPDGSKQELVRGVIETMPPPGFTHGEVQLSVGSLLRGFVKQHRLGRVTVESGLVTESDPDTVRGPDVAFWSYERLPAETIPEVYPDVPADLCVEVLTPVSNRRKLIGKIGEYFASGVRLVWVVDPEARTVSVYHKPGSGTILWDDATLTGNDVLPGFSCAVADLFN